MRTKHSQIFLFVPFVILFCFLFVSCSKKSTKQDEPSPEPAWSQIVRDYDYLQRTFYYLGQDELMNYGGHTHLIPYQNEFFLGDSIIDIKLFKSNLLTNNPTTPNLSPFGIAHVDPKNEDTLESYNEIPLFRRFEEINPDSYFVNRTQYWIQLYKSLQTNDILAAYYVIRRLDAKVDTVGYIKDSCSTSEGDTCMKLKLIKPETPKPKYFTWEYEWKNVYFLRAKNIAKEGFKLDVYKGPLNAGNIQVDKNTQDGTLYLQIFGLDQLDIGGNPQPDGRVDYRQVDFVSGYLIFPERYPFSPPPGVSYTGNPADTLKERVNAIYNSNNLNDRREDSKYYIYVAIYTSKTAY
jgi:cell surface protein SprA